MLTYVFGTNSVVLSPDCTEIWTFAYRWVGHEILQPALLHVSGLRSQVSGFQVKLWISYLIAEEQILAQS